MLTVAVPEGETTPDIFVLDMRKVPWDGSAGVTLTAEWDGQGMAATQSHAMLFEDFPAVRIAWPGQLPHIQEATAGLTQCCFTAVIAGVAEVALDTAREQVARRRDGLRAYERLEWARAELEGWLIKQAYEGMLRAMEEGRDSRLRSVQAKTAIAELAESVLQRICRVIVAVHSPGPRRSATGSRMCERSAFYARHWVLLTINCLPSEGYFNGERAWATLATMMPHRSLAASISSSRNHASGGSLVARRCQAIDTVAERSIGSGMISTVAEICRLR